jgi:plastocyanin
MSVSKNIRKTPSLRICLFSLAWIVFHPLLAAQGSGTIKGTIEIPPYSKSAPVQVPSRYGSLPAMESREGSKTVRTAEVTNVVVYLEGQGLENVHRNCPPAVLDQRNATFIPHVLSIVKGTTVKIVNRDKTYHNVFSLSSTKKFDIGRRPTGEEVPETFDKAGIVQVFCDIHSHMSAYIIVLDNPLFVQPKADGTYTIEGVPAGKYSIHVWHERFSASPQSVVVTSGEATTVDFRLQ